jgi:hypothetical protein
MREYHHYIPRNMSFTRVASYLMIPRRMNGINEDEGRSEDDSSSKAERRSNGIPERRALFFSRRHRSKEMNGNRTQGVTQYNCGFSTR